MRVLLIPPKNNYPIAEPRVDIFGQGFPYIAGALKQSGHEVFGLNINHLWCDDSAANKLNAMMRQAIGDYQPDVIGLGGLSGDYVFIRDALAVAREYAPDTPVVLGGGIMTYDREFVFSGLRPDFGVIGEAEETIVSLLDSIGRGAEPEQVNNVSYWKNSKAVYTPEIVSETPLENLPLPDYEPFDYRRFLESFQQLDHFYTHKRRRPRIMPVSIGRSCPFRCSFCVHSVRGGPVYRERPIDDAIREIAYFYHKYEFNILFIYDEVLSLHKERVSQLCRELTRLRTEEGMDFDWTCDLRVTDVSSEMLGEMKAAGCAFIGYGLESASQPVLNSMRKGTKVAGISKAMELSRQAGIGVQGNFIFGDIAETPATAQETLEFYRDNCRDIMVFLSYIMPYPGSEIFGYCLDNGIIADKLSYYERLAPFGQMKINMTAMPGAEYEKLIQRIEKLGSPEAAMRDFRQAPVQSCKFTGETADTEVPEHKRRLLYEVATVCPHCGEPNEYLCPMNRVRQSKPEVFITFCAKCHRRFVILPLDDTRPRERVKEFKRLVMSIMPPPVRRYIRKLRRAE